MVALLLVYSTLHIITLALGYCTHQHHTSRHNHNENSIRELETAIADIRRALRN